MVSAVINRAKVVLLYACPAAQSYPLGNALPAKGMMKPRGIPSPAVPPPPPPPAPVDAVTASHTRLPKLSNTCCLYVPLPYIPAALLGSPAASNTTGCEYGIVWPESAQTVFGVVVEGI